MSYPPELKYTQSHEWVRVETNTITIGISWFAQDSMGDVVHVELPEVGQVVDVGDATCEVESVKAVSDVYSPVSGEIIEVNESLEDAPESLNSAPYESWLFKVRPSATLALHGLMTAAEYQAHCET